MALPALKALAENLPHRRTEALEALEAAVRDTPHHATFTATLGTRKTPPRLAYIAQVLDYLIDEARDEVDLLFLLINSASLVDSAFAAQETPDFPTLCRNRKNECALWQI